MKLNEPCFKGIEDEISSERSIFEVACTILNCTLLTFVRSWMNEIISFQAKKLIIFIVASL